MTGYDDVVDKLARAGWAVQPGFLSTAETAALAACAQARAPRFQRAGVGRADGHTVDAAIRGDSVLWLDEGDPALQPVMARLEALRQTLNRELFLGLAHLECHFATYPPGARYQRHLDQHRGQDTRAITLVLYLNPDDWRAEHGGQLRLYTADERFEDVQPTGGTLVLFRSERFEHEVLPALRERRSLTGWFRRREAGL
ncbi:2OG-Fe(II) oxygenase [Chitiniphilus purpureus]|uniref:2OG-Fe(II) oxygenase n=1 Tax=Chitiniphilus purpureus TaxID=2981137 RepID=A0ABY6DS43_9NEIS|nr:2OG-Fe(II) oxygenase [Chitiniphilus sp. CD1]UXY15906.1 2OG-Fe(II) oxygenase [Chitiniphilus sp. CD1]